MPLPREEYERTAKAYAENGYNIPKTADALDLSRSGLQERITMARRLHPDLPFPPSVRLDTNALDIEPLQDAVNAIVIHRTQTAAAAALGISRSALQNRLRLADQAGVYATVRGQESATIAERFELPDDGVKRYILTCAQNNTTLHEPTWRAFHALAAYYDANVMVATLTYIHSHEGSSKRGSTKQDKDMWYDPRIEPYVCDKMVALAPNLIWNGHTNIIPTAVEPLSGWENYNHRASSIFPHVKVAMRSVPTVRAEGTKLQYTTGTVTQRNYTQKKAGQRAEFDHVYGALLVEVTPEGSWFVRQLNVDGSGGLYDLDIMVTAQGEVTAHNGVTAIQFGDVHAAQLEDDMFTATWGAGGMVDALKPKYQFMHDLLDFESRGHHSLRDPFKMFELHTKERDSVRSEIAGVANVLRQSRRPRCKTVIVQSNHDLHFERWLREGSWKNDPKNAVIHTKATLAFLEAIERGEPFNALKWALETYEKNTLKGVEWADPDEGYLILKNDSGGIEMGLHGDLGPNGSRGSLRNLSRLGRKVCIGHSHSAGIHNGAYQSGVKARLNMDYARGAPSSWTQSDIVVYPNGKRQIITWWRGRYRA
ncbi:MAG TPA: hypothetical protein PKE16_10130 [Hyphomicrobium sp.]|nr:hypothetical protein [Hyphomicrobium sp.]